MALPTGFVEHGVLAAIFGGTGGAVQSLLGVRRGRYDFDWTWFALSVFAGFVGAWAVNFAFADSYLTYLPLVDLAVGFSIIALLEVAERKLVKRVEKFFDGN